MNNKITKEERKEKYPATCIAHWATGPVNCCDKHGTALVNLGSMLGTHVALTQLLDPKECTNCINENV